MENNKINRVYKACQNSIVTMELCEDSITNENRIDIVDLLHAKFRTNEVKVISIVHPITKVKMDEDRSIYDKNFIYKIGETRESNYSININKICAAGIHYFKTYEAALSWYYRNTSNEIEKDGTYIGWYDNGQKWYEENYKDGEYDGLCQWWYQNGQKKYEQNYKDGKLDGICQGWYENGQKKCEDNYKDGELDGLCQEWYDNGTSIK